IESICLNQDAVGTKPSSVIPKRSTSDDVEECRAGTSEMFRTYASCRGSLTSRLLFATLCAAAKPPPHRSLVRATLCPQSLRAYSVTRMGRVLGLGSIDPTRDQVLP